MTVSILASVIVCLVILREGQALWCYHCIHEPDYRDCVHNHGERQECNYEHMGLFREVFDVGHDDDIHPLCFNMTVSTRNKTAHIRRCMDKAVHTTCADQLPRYLNNSKGWENARIECGFCDTDGCNIRHN